ncbi:MAG TPA: hypothetical protein VMR08_04265 [Patescibacteria group bacterium]|nr:hypothetical protein [Patescibacteria group bacterium]
MKKSPKKQLLRELHKLTTHSYFKKTGIAILSGLALFYLLYQLFCIVGIFKSV